MTKRTTLFLVLTLLILATAGRGLAGDDIGMFGNTLSRNMVSDETGLPASWDARQGTNIRWMQPLGSQSYGGPVVAGGSMVTVIVIGWGVAPALAVLVSPLVYLGILLALKPLSDEEKGMLQPLLPARLRGSVLV